MKVDIATRVDLERLLQQFYERLLQDEEMAYIFLEVAQLDLPSHLPSIVDFWEQAVLQGQGYQRNVLRLHQDLHAQFPLQGRHFEQWLAVFEATVDDFFEGVVAQQAKNRARSVALVLQARL